MARLQRLKPITYTQLLELSGMADATKKEIRDTFRMTSQQQGNYSATGTYRENIPVEVVLLGVLSGKINVKQLAAVMLQED